MPRTYPTIEMRKRSVATMAPPAKAARCLLVKASVPWIEQPTSTFRTKDGRRKEKGERIRTRDFKPKDDGQYAREQNPEKRHGDDAYADGKTATEPGTLENEVQDATTHGVVALERRYVSVTWRFRDRQQSESR
jgi:hypothetical protein